MRLAIQGDGGAVTVGRLPRGDEGIAATIAAMQAAVDWSVYGPRSGVLFEAADVAQRMGGGDFERGVYQFCADGFRFFPDPRGVELLRLPYRLLGERRRAGVALCDCDDRAVLGCSLLWAGRLRGYWHLRAPVLITVGRTGAGMGGRFEHVFWGSVSEGDGLSSKTVRPSDPQERVPFGSFGRATARLKFWRLSPGVE